MCRVCSPVEESQESAAAETTCGTCALARECKNERADSFNFQFGTFRRGTRVLDRAFFFAHGSASLICHSGESVFRSWRAIVMLEVNEMKRGYKGHLINVKFDGEYYLTYISALS